MDGLGGLLVVVVAVVLVVLVVVVNSYTARLTEPCRLDMALLPQIPILRPGQDVPTYSSMMSPSATASFSARERSPERVAAGLVAPRSVRGQPQVRRFSATRVTPRAGATGKQSPTQEPEASISPTPLGGPAIPAGAVAKNKKRMKKLLGGGSDDESDGEGDDGDGAEGMPNTYCIRGAPKPRWGPCLPDYELWVTLNGGNGTWARKQAYSVWEEQMQKHKEYEQAERNKDAERRRQRKLAAEAERKRKEDLEQYIASHEQRELERQERENEKRRLEAEKEAEEQRKREKEAEWRAKRRPKECWECAGSGHCPTCTGKGFVFRFYPASTTSMNLYPTASCSRGYGRTNGGCPACGGSGDETWSNYVQGTGHCRKCKATGMIEAPAGGWD